MPKRIDKSLIVELYKSGFTQRDIGYIVGCSVSTVNSVLKANHVKLPEFRELSEEDIDKILYYYEKGFAPSFIARMLKVKASKVISILAEYTEWKMFQKNALFGTKTYSIFFSFLIIF